MKPVVDILEEMISAAMKVVSGQEGCAALVRPATDPKFGDYQVNGIMPLAKQVKINPRKLAEQVVKNLDVSAICEQPEVAGPGFINLRLKPDFVADRLSQISKDAANLGVEKTPRPQTIVVDFSSPNIAKEMHVGHLRSTIIGDCICRLFEFLGHKVIRQNHIGDWGTQFGMVILGLWHICMAEKHRDKNPYYQTELEGLKANTKDRQSLKVVCLRIRDRQEKDWRDDFIHELGDGKKAFMPFLDKLKVRDENELWGKILLSYQYMNMLEETITSMELNIPTVVDNKVQDIPFESLSRHVTAMLQKGGEKNRQEQDAWKFVTELTLKHCDGIYSRLVVKLGRNDVRGESAYEKDLPKVVEDLKKSGLARESEGAICIFPPEFKDKEGKPLPAIIQKSDGAYLYATTDLAAIRYRVNALKADRIIYVTDARQTLHFQMLFAVARMAGWAPENVELVHVTFGSVLGENGRPLKTREGENVKLKELLDEAVERAKAIVEEKNPELPAEQKEDIAKAVGIGAVKYADYSNSRTSNYVFSFDKMLAMDGNTAPYMQYAYARIKSIGRKAQSRGIDTEGELAPLLSGESKKGGRLSLTEPSELDLAKHLIRYGEAIEAAVADYRPNYLTGYLYELAQKFSAFYTDCPVLDAGQDKRPTRLLLCDLTALTIAHGLHNLLGIEVVEQM